jgi:AmiR/NasT family two-component response regulator
VGYLVKPIKLANLEPVIVLAMRRFEQIQELSKEATNLRQAVTDLRNIEQAMASS